MSAGAVGRMLLRCTGLGVEAAGRRILDNVSLEAYMGRPLAVIGPNGSGKTTLLKSIAGLVGHSGSVYLDGRELSRMPARAVARLVSYSSDIALPEYMDLRVYEAVAVSRYPVSTGFFETERDYEEIRWALRSVGALELWDRRLGSLSSGEMRRVVLAMAIARHPRVLLLDEPDSFLDARGRVEVSRIIRRLSGETVTVFATHDLVFAANTASYMVALHNGRVVAEGGVDEVLRPSVLEKIYGVEMVVVVENGSYLIAPRYR